MPTIKEIEKVKQWCEQKKMEKNRVYVVERNPFKEEIEWTRRFPLIEIDRPKEKAGKSSLVYDSVMNDLWQYLGERWMRIEPSIEITIE